eukprot:768410-Hanusia_phi.AAC.3
MFLPSPVLHVPCFSPRARFMISSCSPARRSTLFLACCFLTFELQQVSHHSQSYDRGTRALPERYRWMSEQVTPVGDL